MLDEIDAETRRTDYMAVTQSAIAKMMAGYFGADLNLPSYMKLMYPDLVEEDTRTGAEIVADLRKKLVG